MALPLIARGSPRRFALDVATVAALVVCALSGCASHANRLLGVRERFFEGRLDEAETAVDEAIKKNASDVDVLRLERSIILLADGRAKEAEQTLRAARDRFDQIGRSSTMGDAGSWLTDDTRRGYAGEDHERILIRALLALSNLMHDGGDAEAYSLQMIDEQARVIEEGKDKDGGENPKEQYKLVALGPYLRGALREATHVHYDDAARGYRQVVEWAPEFVYGAEDLERVTTGTHSSPGQGAAYVFAFTGRGPFKAPSPEVPSTAAIAIAGGIVGAAGGKSLPPTIAPIEVLRIVASQNVIAGLGVDVDGQAHTQTETLVDVTQIAVSQHEAVLPRIVARAIARRALKKGMVYGAKEMAGVKQGSLTGLAFDLAGAAWEGTEAADTRCWGLLPDRIQACRLELPAGDHKLSLRPIDVRGRPIGPAVDCDVTIEDGRNTYVLANFPNSRIAGRPLTRTD